jgi:predicted ATPase
MVYHLLSTENIDSDLEDLILEKTEGVPFFVEEFVKSLKELNIIERKDSKYILARNIQEVIIPSTIQDVIMARVDTLPEGAKELLQTGSVIEREFSYELIKRVSGISQEELLSHLSVLKDSELLYERGIYPQSTYVFKHALTQEVVYDSILTRKKKELHDKIGKAIEQLYKDNLHEHYGLLAEHFIISENFEKGADYSKLAERKAEKAASLNDAISYAKKKISCLEKLPVDDDVEKKIISARTVLGLYYGQMTQVVEAKETVDPIIDLAIKHNYQRRISQIYLVLGLYEQHVEENTSKALEYLKKGLKLGEELNDILSVAIANILIGFNLFIECQFSNALSCHKKALAINTAANALWGAAANTAQIAFQVYVQQGKIDLAYETSKEALRIANQSGDIYSKAHVYPAHGWSCYGKGYLEEAKEYLLKGALFAEKINHITWAASAHWGLGDTNFDMEEYNRSQIHFGKSFSLYRQNGLFPSFIEATKAGIGRAKVMNNDKDIILNEILKCYDDYKLKWNEGWLLNCIGKILLNLDNQHISEAEDWIKRAIETHKKYGMMWFLARDYALYADLFKRKGDLLKARERLGKAIEILKECGADGWVEKYEKELVAL